MAEEGFLNSAALNEIKVSESPFELLTLLGVKSH